MFRPHLMAVALLVPNAVSAQRACSARPVTVPGLPGPVFAACATDRPARIREMTPGIRYPSVLAAAGIRPVSDPSVFLIIGAVSAPLKQLVLGARVER